MALSVPFVSCTLVVISRGFLRFHFSFLATCPRSHRENVMYGRCQNPLMTPQRSSPFIQRGLVEWRRPPSLVDQLRCFDLGSSPVGSLATWRCCWCRDVPRLAGPAPLPPLSDPCHLVPGSCVPSTTWTGSRCLAPELLSVSDMRAFPGPELLSLCRGLNEDLLTAARAQGC